MISADSRLVYVGGSLLWHREMVLQMTRREVLGRYRGSVMGLFWSLVTPLIMLAVYTFVFGYVFKAHWSTGTGSGSQGRWGYALTLFAGLIVFGFFAECLNRAPTLILANVNFVKKVVFPVEVLPWVCILSSLFHAAISLCILIVVSAVVTASVPWTIVLVPLVVLPFLLFTIGLTWFLAALGVYLRDVGQTVGIFTSAMMFASPIFYPVSALPDELQGVFRLNPITIAVEELRAVVLEGRVPSLMEWSAFTGVAIFVAWLGLAWFQRARRGFADVL